MTEAVQTSLKDQVKHGFDEILILITCTEILIGFQYTAVFENAFSSLPPAAQDLQLIGLVLLLLSLLLIMSPVTFHHIADHSKDTPRFCVFLRRIILIALPPFALSLGLDMVIIAGKILGAAGGLIAGVGTTLAALVFWYGIEYLRRQRDGRAHMNPIANRPQSQPIEEPKLSDKVDHVLSETRVVLPGVQALLGFQFISVLTDGFSKLPQSSQILHLVSLLLIALSTILLMTPAAYHRIVEQGEDTEHFHRLAARFVLGGMATLALSIVINFYIVAEKITASSSFAIASAALLLLLFFGFWFGFTLYKRQHRT